jgi:poly-gamma-glutamate synthesis protein (capsule biosynthesis protein)
LTASEEGHGDREYEGFQDPVYFESVIAVVRFEKNQLAELRLYPIELGYLKRLADRGVPRLASPQQTKSILEHLQKLSAPFGTRMTIENNVGVIRLEPATGNAHR